MADKSTIQDILNQIGKGTASPEQCKELRELIVADKTGAIAEEANIFFSGEADITSATGEPSVYWQTVLAKIVTVEKGRALIDGQGHGDVRHIHIFKTAWLRYAAAILLIMATGVLILSRHQHRTPDQASIQPGEKDVLPGGAKAVLTLADGRTVTLDSTGKGLIAEQGSSSVVKLINGEIRYDAKGRWQGQASMNTLSTPRGGQYQLTLPDGTKVWLNAASSITYPVAFIEGKRQVEITGEAYFEVAKDKAKPFIVAIEGRPSIEVLGTQFNVNSYAGEGNIRTTLLEGAVRVGSGREEGVVLRPGQQASQRTGNPIQVTYNVDVDQVVAWKNGLFNFNGADLHTVMRQLERWYDIEVRYEGKTPDVVLGGEMYRNVPLSDVMNFFFKMNVNMKLKGKELIVSGK